MRIGIVVTHLLGTGHLSRAITLADACVNRGHSVQVISGGRPAPHLSRPGIDILQLPPVASDGVNFTRLLDEEDQPVDENFMLNRKQVAVKALADFAPDVLVTELYPFGRRILKSEFLAILNQAKELTPRPRIYASIRDILAPPSKPAKALESEAMLAAFYDGVFVHSDPDTTPLSASWPVTPTLEDKLVYTGYVAPAAPAAHSTRAGEGEVLVSAGGGSVGRSLYEMALRAAAQSDLTWRLLVGGTDSAAEVARLQALGPPNTVVEPARPDFRQMLNHAAVSVSMCGYNTAIDLLQTGCPSVLVPFDDGGEVEQTLRAQSLAKRSQFQVLKAGELTPELLAKGVKAATEQNRKAAKVEFKGALQMVEYLEETS
ncbi:MAG: glycosyltransferase [Pseudomonadota bacterium]